jgi:hypothetical protein
LVFESQKEFQDSKVATCGLLYDPLRKLFLSEQAIAVQWSQQFVVQVPATSITTEFTSAMNEHLLSAVNATFEGSPEMRLTDTGIDDTLLSYVRCAVAPPEQLLQAGWLENWSSSDPGDLPLDTMARLVQPVDFNTEAKACPLV